MDGVIVPMEVEECAVRMAEFIADVPKQRRIVEYLQTHDYGNENEVNKIYDLLR